MNQLFQTLINYKESDYYPFHMPGHKRNMEGYLNSSIYGLDITEIEGFDNLHQPEGILLESQKKAASLYESAKTYFLINGSTCGILSSISTVVSVGGKLLMGRNSHKAAYHAVLIRQLQVAYLYPEILEEFNVFGGINPLDVEEAMKQDSLIEAVFITSPTADGIVSDIGEIAKICHKYQKPLIVDEAHGAHFGFGNIFPQTSIRAEADIVIHSVHKTLPALTQTALLHCNGDLVSIDQLQQFLGIYQSSSPSYILMAGIDQCVEIITKEKDTLFDCFEQKIICFRKECQNLQNIKIMDQEVIGNQYVYQIDLSKIVISVQHTNITGQNLYDILLKKYHLQMEMAAESYVLGITTIMDTKEGFDRLTQALREIDKELFIVESKTKYGQVITMRDPIYSLYQASVKEKELCNIEKSIGKICGDFIVVYPPGLPLVVLGEKLTEEIVNQIELYQGQGLTVQGIKDNKIKIIKETI